MNRQLEKMGFNIGVRIVEDFLARTNSGKCTDLRWAILSSRQLILPRITSFPTRFNDSTPGSLRNIFIPPCVFSDKSHSHKSKRKVEKRAKASRSRMNLQLSKSTVGVYRSLKDFLGSVLPFRFLRERKLCFV